MPYTQDWTTGRVEHWLTFLPDKVGMPNLRFLEIGCFEGRTTVWLLTNILTDPTSLIFCVDPFVPIKSIEAPTDHSLERFLSNTATFRKQIKLHIMESAKFYELNMARESSLDFAYVDGSHIAANVYLDGVNCWKLLKHDGILIFDDYHWATAPAEEERPKLGIDKFLREKGTEYKLLRMNGQVAVRKL